MTELVDFKETSTMPPKEWTEVQPGVWERETWGVENFCAPYAKFYDGQQDVHCSLIIEQSSVGGIEAGLDLQERIARGWLECLFKYPIWSADYHHRPDNERKNRWFWRYSTEQGRSNGPSRFVVRDIDAETQLEVASEVKSSLSHLTSSKADLVQLQLLRGKGKYHALILSAGHIYYDILGALLGFNTILESAMQQQQQGQQFKLDWGKECINLPPSVLGAFPPMTPAMKEQSKTEIEQRMAILTTKLPTTPFLIPNLDSIKQDSLTFHTRSLDSVTTSKLLTKARSEGFTVTIVIDAALQLISALEAAKPADGWSGHTYVTFPGVANLRGLFEPKYRDNYVLQAMGDLITTIDLAPLDSQSPFEALPKAMQDLKRSHAVSKAGRLPSTYALQDFLDILGLRDEAFPAQPGYTAWLSSVGTIESRMKTNYGTQNSTNSIQVVEFSTSMRKTVAQFAIFHLWSLNGCLTLQASNTGAYDDDLYKRILDKTFEMVTAYVE